VTLGGSPFELPGKKTGSRFQKELVELLRVKQRRLHVLELQAAKYGVATPPHITLEIEDLREEITSLAERLNEEQVASLEDRSKQQ
jgi:hypothetical protein